MRAALSLGLAALFVAAVSGQATPKYPSGIPVNAVLTAPWTPFTGPPSFALNLTAIPAYAANIAQQGPNVVWIGGGMGQFDVMTVAERKALAAAWLIQTKKYGLYSIVHCGTTVQAEAIEMAAHAAAHGADAIAAVPPYYEHPASPLELAQWFAPIVAAGGNRSFFYYHIPGSTGVTMKMSQFVPAAVSVLGDAFAGIKFVDNDQQDYFSIVTQYGDRLQFMWAPEPKLGAILLGARGVILAESFYAGTWLRMCHHALAGNWTGAHLEQQWKYNVDTIFGMHGGTNAKRAVYRRTGGVDIGPERPPHTYTPMTDAVYDSLVSQLTAAGFFDQQIPGPCVLPKSW